MVNSALSFQSALIGSAWVLLRTNEGGTASGTVGLCGCQAPSLFRQSTWPTQDVFELTV